jgi:hypothetical protein
MVRETTDILVPILTEKELDQRFLDDLGRVEKLVLVFVVDQTAMDVPAGLAGGKIKNAEKIMGDLKKRYKKALVTEYIEWGSWPEKLRNIALLERAQQIVAVNCQLGRELSRKMKDQKIDMRLVSLPELPKP